VFLSEIDHCLHHQTIDIQWQLGSVTMAAWTECS